MLILAPVGTPHLLLDSCNRKARTKRKPGLPTVSNFWNFFNYQSILFICYQSIQTLARQENYLKIVHKQYCHIHHITYTCYIYGSHQRWHGAGMVIFTVKCNLDCPFKPSLKHPINFCTIKDIIKPSSHFLAKVWVSAMTSSLFQWSIETQHLQINRHQVDAPPAFLSRYHSSNPHQIYASAFVSSDKSYNLMHLQTCLLWNFSTSCQMMMSTSVNVVQSTSDCYLSFVNTCVEHVTLDAMNTTKKMEC